MADEAASIQAQLEALEREMLDLQRPGTGVLSSTAAAQRRRELDKMNASSSQHPRHSPRASASPRAVPIESTRDENNGRASRSGLHPPFVSAISSKPTERGESPVKQAAQETTPRSAMARGNDDEAGADAGYPAQQRSAGSPDEPTFVDESFASSMGRASMTNVEWPIDGGGGAPPLSPRSSVDVLEISAETESVASVCSWLDVPSIAPVGETVACPNPSRAETPLRRRVWVTPGLFPHKITLTLRRSVRLTAFSFRANALREISIQCFSEPSSGSGSNGDTNMESASCAPRSEHEPVVSRTEAPPSARSLNSLQHVHVTLERVARCRCVRVIELTVFSGYDAFVVLFDFALHGVAAATAARYQSGWEYNGGHGIGAIR
jgi:hypothetical protein